MGIFRSTRIAKKSALRHAPAAGSAEAIRLPEACSEIDLTCVDEVSVVRDRTDGAVFPLLKSIESATRPGAESDGDSDVYVCRRSNDGSRPELEASDASLIETALAEAAAEAAQVTLFVYGWENVEPGTLSWAFPSVRAALTAVKTMRNAIGWCIIGGNDWATIESARAAGHVLIEQNA